MQLVHIKNLNSQVNFTNSQFDLYKNKIENLNDELNACNEEVASYLPTLCEYASKDDILAYRNLTKSYTFENISVKVPNTWSGGSWPGESKPLGTGLRTLFNLFKGNLSAEPSFPDEPTKNVVVVDVRSLNTKKPLRALVSNFHKEIGIPNHASDSFFLEQGYFNGYPSIFIFDDIGKSKRKPEKAAFPIHVLFRTSEEEVIVLIVEFFDHGKDEEYSIKTTEEIIQVLKSMSVNN